MAVKKKDYFIDAPESEDMTLKKNFKVNRRQSLTTDLKVAEEREVSDEEESTEDQVSREDQSLVNIVVEEKDRSYKISPNKLEKILSSNKRVKRIVIEDIAVDKAKRMHIDVDNKLKKKNTYQQIVSDVQEQESRIDANRKEELIEYTETTEEKENIRIDQVELVRRKGRPKNISSYYYRAKEHLDLYQVGMSFLRDIRENKKCFSFCPLENKDGQQSTILGIAVFLMFHTTRKSLVITHDFDNSIYSKIMGNKVSKKIVYKHEEITYPVVDCDGVRFIEYLDIFKLMTSLKHSSYEDFIDHLTSTNETLLVDLPEMSKLDKKREVFFPLINCVDNISLIVNFQNLKRKKLLELSTYFEKYEVPIKGVIFSGKNK